jgi:hypothetical protein
LPSEPPWLEPDEVIAINRAVVADTGEPFGLLDRGLLEGRWPVRVTTTLMARKT